MVQFSKEAAKRIAKVVRQVEQSPVQRGFGVATRKGRGGGDGGDLIYVAPTKAELPSVEVPALGYAEDTGRYYTRAISSWICFTHLEA
jgi:hypothetical protein